MHIHRKRVAFTHPPEQVLHTKQSILQFSSEMEATFSFVGIGTDLDEDEIFGISSGDQYVFMASDFDAVQNLTNAIAEEICIEGKKYFIFVCK